jgi:hypothetical protein
MCHGYRGHNYAATVSTLRSVTTTNRTNERMQAHAWFKGIDWDNIHRTEAPFKPQLSNAEDTRHFDQDIPAEVSRRLASGVWCQGVSLTL